ncbi:HDIG domain-containing metalloprotein [Clostridium uliginosum]|uniref:HDIG domain-containing protein n=1 Tax=Clostridium uliginosum TaxID=119641 RepID=A0A1I1LJJ9_9CLOT|nr:HDIG domain-containing metalloprotein [Clostridium uliginosum]SFC69660.1 HDIG domain-containing protein [Clostridium uliginosum]
MIYRMKQFYWGFISLLKKDDDCLLNKYLNANEKGLFMKLNKSERQHSVRVCKESINYIDKHNMINIKKDRMAKCALLHDIGKIKSSLNVVEKGLLVIINKVTLGRFLKYTKYSKIIDYYNHPKLGVESLKQIGIYDNEVLYCIERHHNEIDNKEIKHNLYLSILIICDNNN